MLIGKLDGAAAGEVERGSRPHECEIIAPSEDRRRGCSRCIVFILVSHEAAAERQVDALHQPLAHATLIETRDDVLAGILGRTLRVAARLEIEGGGVARLVTRVE